VLQEWGGIALVLIDSGLFYTDFNNVCRVDESKMSLSLPLSIAL
jgi:hypothetical protein